MNSGKMPWDFGSVSRITTISGGGAINVTSHTNGTKTTFGNYTVYTYLSSGDFNTDNGGDIEVLLVGGGAGGGSYQGGGGGAGGTGGRNNGTQTSNGDGGTGGTNTGSGGGGSGYHSSGTNTDVGGAGGSGIIVVRHLT